MLGELIHNPQVVSELEKEGINIINQINDLPKNSTVIIRAHGVSNKRRKQLLEKKIKIIDGSCPFVTKAHLLAQQFVKQGLQLVIIGDRNHPEIRGIYEDFSDAWIIKTKEEINTLPFQSLMGLGVICQTTLKQDEVEQIVALLKIKYTKVEFQNTICSATDSKQKAAKELAEKVDLMLIVGGKKSNNTLSLYTLCKKICSTQLISDISELQMEWFQNIKTLGITGGASTPLWLIEKVRDTIQKNLFNHP